MSLLAWLLLAQVVPGAAWEHCAPEAAGLSREKLDALRDLASGRGCVVRGGRLAYTWGDASKSGDVASAMEPVISTLLLMAVHEGRLGSVDARVSDVEPRLEGKDSAITWRHLACRISGYGLEEAPGAAYAHNDHGLALTYDTLMGKVFRENGTKVLKDRLGVALGFQDPVTFEAFGPQDQAGRLAISPRDFARFGLLVLRGGAWGERALVPPGLLYMSISSAIPASTPLTGGKERAMLPGQRALGDTKRTLQVGPGCYSFSWWLNGVDDGRRPLFVDGPGDLVAALGQGGIRALWIIPSLDLVISWNDAKIDDHERSPGDPDTKINRAVRLMVESVIRAR